MLARVAKTLIRQTIGHLPPPAARLSGKLAIHGGAPVRDLRQRPYAGGTEGAALAWLTSVGPAFRRVFTSGVEGLPLPLTREFERRWADYCGCRHALLLPHGTDALRIALAAAFDHDGLGYGGEVIVPNLSFIASATSCLDRRFGVALVDVDPATLTLDPARVAEAIAPGRTCAIMAVHQFGAPADMTTLLDIARRHGLKVFEDAAQAHGAAWESGMVGALGDAGAFSFQSSKTLACGEGGALTTNDGALFDRARMIANVGRAFAGGERWEHPGLGWNCRPTEYQAALLLDRLRRFNAQQRRRAENFERLAALLRGSRALVPLESYPAMRRHGMYMFAMRYDPAACGGTPLATFLAALRGEGAPIRKLYSATIAGQPVMRRLAGRRPGYLRVLPTPVADRAIHELIYFPHEIFLGPPRDIADIAAAVEKVETYFAGGSR